MTLNHPPVVMRPMSIRARFNRLDELANEYRLGISTFEFHELFRPGRPDDRGYAPTAFRDWRIMRPHLAPRRDVSFIDYGAGLGRVTVLAGRLDYRQSIGVEFDRELAQRGNANIARARGLRCPTSIACGDATEFSIPEGPAVVFFCNPFTGNVLDAVLSRIVAHPAQVELLCNLPEASTFARQVRSVPRLVFKRHIELSDRRECLLLSHYG